MNQKDSGPNLISKISYVEVAFPMHFNQTFTYRWSSEFFNDPLGYRVLVPFQKRLLTGYVLNQSQQDQQQPIKDIQDVLDDTPILTQELITLIHYIRNRYGASLGEALQTVIPAGLIQQTKKKLIPSDQIGNPSTEEENKILDMIRKKKSIDWNSWIKKNSESISTVRKLQKNGWVQFETLLQPQKAKERKETVYFISTDAAKKLLKGKKQISVFETVQNQGEATSSALKEIFGTTVLSTLHLLEEKGVLQKKIIPIQDSPDLDSRSVPLKLTSEQEKTVNRIENAIQKKERVSILLHGVTGSGKTEVYLQAAERCLALGRNVLALVPEISLTPQFLSRFQKRFGRKIALLHSQRSETERVLEWKRILDGKAQIVVGTRSSVFSPLQNIGLFILDEEHDRSYKQDDHVMYHAKDIVLMRAAHEQAVILLGSATPSIETFHLTQDHLIEKAVLSNRIQGQEMPEVEIVDLQKEKKFGESTMFSEKLKDAIEHTLHQGKQTILFLNRRGYSTHVYCPTCGSTLQCPNCSISMTFHKEQDSFQCHYCDFTLKSNHPCPGCQSAKWIRFGFGTERVEKELKFLFPDAVIDRLDRDTVRKKNAFDTAFSNFENRKTDILIGTQIITKGLDFEHVDLVGVLLADQGLHFPDFRAAEHTFQLLTQVIGRSGRGTKRGKAILQTLQPDHYAIIAASRQNYQEFYNKEIEYRRQAAYPPFSKVILFEVRGKQKENVLQMSQWLKKQIDTLRTKDPTLVVLGPSPAPIEKINLNYRFHLFLKSSQGSDLEKATQWIYSSSKEEFHKRDLHLKYNIDPFDFM